MRSSGCGLVEAGALVTSQPRPPTAGTSVTFPHCAGGAPSYLPLADGTNPYPATVIDCARPAPGRLGAARPHAHAPLGHRGSPAGRGHSREPEGRRTPRGPWIGPHLQGLRRRVQEARGDPIHGSSRLQRGRRTGRVIHCHVEARGPHRRALLDRRAHPPAPDPSGGPPAHNTLRRHTYRGHPPPTTYEKQTPTTTPTTAA